MIEELSPIWRPLFEKSGSKDAKEMTARLYQNYNKSVAFAKKVFAQYPPESPVQILDYKKDPDDSHLFPHSLIKFSGRMIKIPYFILVTSVYVPIDISWARLVLRRMDDPDNFHILSTYTSDTFQKDLQEILDESWSLPNTVIDTTIDPNNEFIDMKPQTRYIEINGTFKRISFLEPFIPTDMGFISSSNYLYIDTSSQCDVYIETHNLSGEIYREFCGQNWWCWSPNEYNITEFISGYTTGKITDEQVNCVDNPAVDVSYLNGCNPDFK